jgi:hypothetical protein
MAWSVHVDLSPRLCLQVSHGRMTESLGAGALYFFHNAETAVSPHYVVCVTMTERLYEGAGSLF